MNGRYAEPQAARTGATLGILLVLAGLAAFGIQAAGIDVDELLDGGRWPMAVLVPGIVLLAAALFAARPAGLGFAIAGSIVTTVGLILTYQESSGHWESWAYVWALIPAAAGLATTGYGLFAQRREMVPAGLRMTGIAAALFVAGFWFFESIFDTGRAPVDLGTWWPLILVAIGAIVLLSSFRTSSARTGSFETDEAPPMGGDPA